MREGKGAVRGHVFDAMLEDHASPARLHLEFVERGGYGAGRAAVPASRVRDEEEDAFVRHTYRAPCSVRTRRRARIRSKRRITIRRRRASARTREMSARAGAS